jgi:hypothetical protein
MVLKNTVYHIVKKNQHSIELVTQSGKVVVPNWFVISGFDDSPCGSVWYNQDGSLQMRREIKKSYKKKDEVTGPDLFGGDTKIVDPAKSPYTRFKQEKNYRTADGHENCGNCFFGCKVNKYKKCHLMGVSASMMSDVSGKKVCNAWANHLPSLSPLVRH